MNEICTYLYRRKLILSPLYNYHKLKKMSFLKNEGQFGRVAQVVECLPTKCETLSSNPSIALLPPKKRKK
jgi:hypothetical protein